MKASNYRYLYLIATTALTLAIWIIYSQSVNSANSSGGIYVESINNLILLHSTLPRLSIALIAGGALGISGAIIQYVLRNPLASPTTLGVDAGAQLAMATAIIFIPELGGIERDAISLIGSLFALILVFVIAGRNNYSSISFLIAGLIVSFYFGILSSVFILIKERFLGELFIWGSGSLQMQSWNPVIELATKLTLPIIVLITLSRSLTILEIGDTSAKSLGAKPILLRSVAIILAAIFSSFVASAVGIIGFISLIGPVLARLSGARDFKTLITLSALYGAFLLLLTDTVLQTVFNSGFGSLPAGTLTAFFGAPLFFILALKKRPNNSISKKFMLEINYQQVLNKRILTGSALIVIIFFSIFLSRNTTGEWQITSISEWDFITEWRLPRIIVAACSGAMLSIAGVIIQRLTQNPLASPEVLGISSGAVLVAVISLFAFGSSTVTDFTIAAAIGALLVIAIIWGVGRYSNYSPEQMLLIGIALSAMIEAFLRIIMISGDPRATMLIGWMVGSTNNADAKTAVAIVAGTAFLIPTSFLFVNWLRIIPLGNVTATSLGIQLVKMRLTMFAYVAIVTALTTLAIGPLTFLGLIGPHIANMVGVRSVGKLLIIAAVIGSTIMILADWIARVAFFPIQIPSGLVAALIGVPYLLYLLSRKNT